MRIGIHTGDIVYDDEGVYGDGINVASRIEGLAISGSVLVSGKVFDEVKNHQAFSTAYLGTFDLKNVSKPMDVYAIANEGFAVPTRDEIKGIPRNKKKSLAVLPFVNMSAYLTKGIWLLIHERFDEAIESIKKGIQLDPFYSPGIYAYAIVLFFSDRIEESSVQLDRLFEINPNFPDATYLRGIIHQSMGEYEKARELFLLFHKIPGFVNMADACPGGLHYSMNQPDIAN